MAQFKFVVNADRTGWLVRDPVTDEQLAELQMPDDATIARNVALYGLKQICSDGAATEKGMSKATRVRLMKQRHDEIHAGTWGFRDGTGSAGLPDADIYRAIVALGLAPDDADRREKWKKLPASHRRAIAKREDVAQWLTDNAPATVDADDALAAFTQ